MDRVQALPRHRVLATKDLLETEDDAERLFQGFKKPAHASRFFKVGRVFLVLWAEPAGESTATFPEAGVSVGRYGERVHSKVRRFVVIRESPGYCSALPITTYGKRGVSRPGVIKVAHAIIYTGKTPPFPLEGEMPARDERGMQDPPIRVDADNMDDKLDALSRIDYGAVHTIQHNIKVKSFGRVNRASMDHLLRHAMSIWTHKPPHPAGIVEAPARQGRLQCSFSRLGCSEAFDGLELWDTHCLSHYRGAALPRRQRCPFTCNWEVIADDGQSAWNERYHHVRTNHNLDLERIDVNRNLAPDAIQHLFRNRIIDDHEMRNLRAGRVLDKASSTWPTRDRSSASQEAQRRNSNPPSLYFCVQKLECPPYDPADFTAYGEWPPPHQLPALRDRLDWEIALFHFDGFTTRAVQNGHSVLETLQRTGLYTYRSSASYYNEGRIWVADPVAVGFPASDSTPGRGLTGESSSRRLQMDSSTGVTGEGVVGSPEYQASNYQYGHDHSSTKELLDWRPLRFRALDSKVSYACRDGDLRRLVTRRADQLWPDLILPDAYTNSQNIAEGHEGGMIGELPLLISLMAFALPEDSVATRLPSLIQHPWRVSEDMVRGLGWQDGRGILVTVYCDPHREGVKYVTPSNTDTLRAYELGEYGPILP